MTIHKRIDTSPAALPKTVAALRRDFEQEKASLGLRSSTITIGGEALVNRDGVLNFRAADGAESPVVPLPSPAPFPNADFEQVDMSGFPTSWTVGPFLTFDPVTFTTDTSIALTGSRSLKVQVPSGGSGTRGGALTSESWLVAEGSTVTVTAYFKASDTNRYVNLGIITNVADGVAATGGAGAVITDSGVSVPSGSTWVPITVSLSMPAGHTRVAARVIGYSSGTTAGTIWIDSVNASAAGARHDDFSRRLQATLLLGLGGTTAVDNTGLISWTGAFYGSPGRQADESPVGPIVIGAMPANGTVIPVHGSNTRTSYTVASGKVLLGFGESLWWRTNFGSSTGAFHIVGKDTDYSLDQGWILICTADQFGTLSGGPLYKWGDGRTESPWQTPTLINSWAAFGAGFDPPQYRRVGGDVELRGLGKGGTIGSVACILPAGYRPSNRHVFTTVADNTAVVRIDVLVDGSVTAVTSIAGAASTPVGFMSFDPVRFAL